VYWKPTEAVLSDVGTFLVDLCKNAGQQSERKEWFDTLRNRENEKQEANYQVSLTIDIDLRPYHYNYGNGAGNRHKNGTGVLPALKNVRKKQAMENVCASACLSACTTFEIRTIT